MMKIVLLVEDNADDAFIMQRAWKKADVLNPLRIVTDGQMAVDYLSGDGEFKDREKHPIPGMILMDIKLPYLSGLEVVKWMRGYEPCRTIPVVFLTSSNADMDIHQAYSLGGSAYLIKPPTPEKLLQMIQDLKGFWIKHNQFPPDFISFEE